MAGTADLHMMTSIGWLTGLSHGSFKCDQLHTFVCPTVTGMRGTLQPHDSCTACMSHENDEHVHNTLTILESSTRTNKPTWVNLKKPCQNI